MPPAQRPTATVFQDYALFPHLTVAANVGFGLSVAALPKAQIAATRQGGAGDGRPRRLRDRAG